MMHITSVMLAFPQPRAVDLWAFWLLAGLWAVILGTTWLLFRWLRRGSDEGHRGL